MVITGFVMSYSHSYSSKRPLSYRVLRFGHRATRTSGRSMKCNCLRIGFFLQGFDLRLHDRYLIAQLVGVRLFHLFKRRRASPMASKQRIHHGFPTYRYHHRKLHFPWLRFGLGLGSDWENYFGFLCFQDPFCCHRHPFCTWGSPLRRYLAKSSSQKDFLVEFLDERTRFAPTSCCRKNKKQRVAPPNRSCSGRSGFRVHASGTPTLGRPKRPRLTITSGNFFDGVDKSPSSSLCSSNRRVWRVRPGIDRAGARPPFCKHSLAVNRSKQSFGILDDADRIISWLIQGNPGIRILRLVFTETVGRQKNL